MTVYVLICDEGDERSVRGVYWSLLGAQRYVSKQGVINVSWKQAEDGDWVASVGNTLYIIETRWIEDD